MQGFAEVAPVSSSAQLRLLPYLAGWPELDSPLDLAAGLHAGSCAGIAWALRHDLRRLDRRTVALVAASCLPAALAGLALGHAVEQRFGRPGPIAGVLAVGGAALWFADRRPSGRPASGPAISVPDAAVAAAAQIVALVPGVSRSGATLTALRWRGVDRSEAVRFSMLMSLPVTAGAAGLSLARAGRVAPGVTVGAPVAAAAGYLATRTLERRGDRLLSSAALYRLGLATAVAARLARQRRTT